MSEQKNILELIESRKIVPVVKLDSSSGKNFTISRLYSSAHIISVGVQAPGKIRIWLSIAYSVTSLENPGVTRNCILR